MRKQIRATAVAVALLALVSTCVLSSTASAAQDTTNNGRGRGERRARKQQLPLDNLGLSAEQREQITAIQQTHQPEIDEARAALRDRRRAVKEARQNGTEVSDAVRQEIADARATHRERFEAMLAEIDSVLTPEQSEQLRNALENRRDGKRRRGHRAGGEQGN